jgi:peptide chain release factor 1
VSSESLPLHQKLADVDRAYEDILMRLSSGTRTPSELQSMNRERARLEPIVTAYRALVEKERERDGNQALVDDSDDELRAMAKTEITRLDDEIDELHARLRVLLVPRDPFDDKDVILEIRAGTGGDEASLFAGDLFRMYAGYAARMGWRFEILSSSEGGRGGYKEVIAEVSGDEVYSHLKQEAGTHRVQRVPETESQGRIHTSACTVAVLPEAEEVEVKIDDKDLRIDVMRAGGPGGQSVNTTDSAVRITHLPTGLVVICQDEKSQLKNKARAMSILRARLYEKMRDEQDSARADSRRSMVGSGDRSEKIRTYNFPQDRCTDHRAGITVHNLTKLMGGEVVDFLDEVRSVLTAEQLNDDKAT